MAGIPTPVPAGVVQGNDFDYTEGSFTADAGTQTIKTYVPASNPLGYVNYLERTADGHFIDFSNVMDCKGNPIFYDLNNPTAKPKVLLATCEMLDNAVASLNAAIRATELVVASGQIINPNTPSATLRLTLNNGGTINIDVSSLEDAVSASSVNAAFPSGAAVTLSTTASGITFLASDGNKHSLQIPATTNTVGYNTATGVLSTSVNGVFAQTTVPVSAQPATTNPIPDNNADSDLRDSSVGTSVQYARADHKHAVRKQAILAYPGVTVAGATLDGDSAVTANATEETIYFERLIQITRAVSSGAWSTIAFPNIAGFANPQITCLGTYRPGAAPAANMPAGPFMGNEACVWATNIIYVGPLNTTVATTWYVRVAVTYTRG